jgi:hypothetical protein
MRSNIADIPTLPVDVFLPELSSQRTGEYFYAHIREGVLVHLLEQWKPIGISLAQSLMSEHSNIAIMFENAQGERTWFHFFDEAVEHRVQRISAAAPRACELVEPRASRRSANR